MSRNRKPTLELHPRYAHLDLWYDVQEWQQDREVSFYTRARINRFGHKKGEFYKISVGIKDSAYCDRKSGRKPNARPQLRRFIKLYRKGKTIDLLCSRLVFQIGWEFMPADHRHWVVDHIDGNTLNDRRSNLRLITQKENCNTPAVREAARRNLIKAREQRIRNLRVRMTERMTEK